MQRRRRSKAVPRDIFGNPSNPASTPKPAAKETASKSPKLSENTQAKPPAKPVSKPPEDPEIPLNPEPVIEDNIEEDLYDEETNLVNEQILRTPRKSIGLRPKTDSTETESEDIVSNRAQEIIEESKERAKTDVITIPKPTPIPVADSPAPPKPKPRRRSRSSSFQPANRAKRLDRSRHMEYKYEMRGLLDNLNIPDEHRSSLLGTIWARGERQTVSEAKQFISEKYEQGVLTEEQKSTLNDVVDRYTVRR